MSTLAINCRHLLPVLIIPFIAVGAGCASRGYQLAGKSADGISVLRSELEEGRTQVSATIDSLNALADQKSGSLGPTYEKFASSLESLRSQAQSVNSRHEHMTAAAEDYLEVWSERLEGTSDEIKKRSEARRQEVAGYYESIRSRYDETRKAFEPFIKDLDGISQLLATDLTPASVDSVRDLVGQSNDDSKAVLTGVDALLKELAKADRFLSSNLDTAKGKADGGEQSGEEKSGGEEKKDEEA